MFHCHGSRGGEKILNIFEKNEKICAKKIEKITEKN